MRGFLEDVAKAIQSRPRLLISWHVDPDPDCVGSGLALFLALKQKDKDVICVSPQPLGERFQFLPGVEACQVYEPGMSLDWDAAVVVDCEPERCGDLAGWLQGGVPVINIDHHQTNPGQGVACWIDPEAAATGELIFQLLKHWRVQWNDALATNLFAAVAGDTGTFRYSNTTATTLRIAAELVQYGAVPGEIAEHLYENRPYASVDLVRQALNTLERSADGKMAWICVTRAMLGENGWQGQESEDFIRYPRMIAGVQLAALFREVEPDKTRVSFRSRQDVDASRVAAVFGGGGHARAAGCTVDRPLAEAKELVLQVMAREVNRQKEPVTAGGEAEPGPGGEGSGRDFGGIKAPGHDLA